MEEKWNGNERRSNQGFCNQHIEWVTDMATIKNSLKNIETTIIESVSFKTSVVTAFISVAVVLVAQLVGFSYFIGQQSKQIDINTRRLSVVEEQQRTENLAQRIKTIRTLENEK